MLTIHHVELADANGFVAEHHRHHKPVAGHRFSIGCYEDDALVGVAIVGRPVARMIDQHGTVEVLRLCTDGTPNTCSKLYGACKRAAKELGYDRIITYVLEAETGQSLKASGWVETMQTAGGTWSRGSRPRIDKHPTTPKRRYECKLRSEEMSKHG